MGSRDLRQRGAGAKPQQPQPDGPPRQEDPQRALKRPPSRPGASGDPIAKKKTTRARRRPGAPPLCPALARPTPSFSATQTTHTRRPLTRDVSTPPLAARPCRHNGPRRPSPALLPAARPAAPCRRPLAAVVASTAAAARALSTARRAAPHVLARRAGGPGAQGRPHVGVVPLGAVLWHEHAVRAEGGESAQGSSPRVPVAFCRAVALARPNDSLQLTTTTIFSCPPSPCTPSPQNPTHHHKTH